MIRGTVVGQVWATRKSRALAGEKLLLVATDEDRLVVGVDRLDARVGQEVLVSWGSGARNVLRPGPDNRDLLCDAAVSLVIDGSTEGAGAGAASGRGGGGGKEAQAAACRREGAPKTDTGGEECS
jgi:microcompartment protein CcmK/EutM